MRVLFEDYDPQRFASLYARVGPKLGEFFARPVIGALLEGSVKLRRPAVEAIERHLLEHVKEEVQNQRVRQLVGHMIRHLMAKRGYVIDQPEVRIPDGLLFTCGARYRLADETLQPQEPIPEGEALLALQLVSGTAAVHTDVLMYGAPGSGNVGLASCLHVRRGGRDLVVTCHHVAATAPACFTTPRRLVKDMVEEGDRRKVQQLTMITSSKELDLALFEGATLDLAAAGRSRYDLTKSAWFTERRLTPDGTAGFIYGLWGEKASVCSYPDGLVYVNAPIYSGVGPIVGVEERLLVVDVAEIKFLYLSDRFKKETPTGGVRELHGISGSGLWMILDHQVCLAGVVLGRKPKRDGEHLIRVTPAWALVTWLDHVLGTS